jgi:hypothetical protein
MPAFRQASNQSESGAARSAAHVLFARIVLIPTLCNETLEQVRPAEVRKMSGDPLTWLLAALAAHP